MEQDGNEWGIETQAFLTGSYHHYKAHGFRADPMLPSQEDLYDKDTVKPTSGSFLPVCDSHLGPAETEDPPLGHPLHVRRPIRQRHRALPRRRQIRYLEGRRDQGG
ncbi:hypothetical protein XPA_010180 [Xanthoria parietina]